MYSVHLDFEISTLRVFLKIFVVLQFNYFRHLFLLLRLVIMSLVDLAHGKHRHVPYRDSRLTFLLQVTFKS